ncbi:MAG: hypothetical protein ABSD38_38075 [Syntrophorhabdales bacterium]|jgi:hypothetical protein
MKKFVLLSVVCVLIAMASGGYAQTGDLKPTFISPTPGLYVNGWPAFTVSYPKDWAEQRLKGPTEVYRAAGLFGIPSLTIRAFATPADLGIVTK